MTKHNVANDSLHVLVLFFQLGLARESECEPCPPGKYCSGAGVDSFPSSISGNCDPGYYCVQGVNTPRPSQNFTGIGGICPPGAYCPEETSDPIGCPNGTFSNVSNLAAPSDCTLCSDGHYCEQSNLTEPTGRTVFLCRTGHNCTVSTSTKDKRTYYINNWYKLSGVF